MSQASEKLFLLPPPDGESLPFYHHRIRMLGRLETFDVQIRNRKIASDCAEFDFVPLS